jgi:hypothetical protein
MELEEEVKAGMSRFSEVKVEPMTLDAHGMPDISDEDIYHLQINCNHTTDPVAFHEQHTLNLNVLAEDMMQLAGAGIPVFHGHHQMINRIMQMVQARSNFTNEELAEAESDESD